MSAGRLTLRKWVLMLKKLVSLVTAAGLAIVLQPVSGYADAMPSRNHVVQPGETLLDIGLFYGASPGDLSRMNALASPVLVQSGEILAVPVSDRQPTQPPTPAITSQPPTPDKPGTYTVQQGDTLFRIATQFGVPMDALAYVNRISYPDSIYVGQVLTIPDSSVVVPQGGPVEPTSTPTPAPTLDAQVVLNGLGPDAATGKQIVVKLSEQTVYVYEDGTLLRQFLASTGLPGSPTVTGDFAIYLKLPSQRMIGPDYDLPNVPWVMYFYQGYGLHGTYWHHNFGHPMSHGCVNLRTPEAEWLYEWAPIGTPVHVVP